MSEIARVLQQLIGKESQAVFMRVFTWNGACDMGEAVPLLQFDSGFLHIGQTTSDESLTVGLTPTAPPEDWLSQEEWIETEREVGAWQTVRLVSHPIAKAIEGSTLSAFQIEVDGDNCLSLRLQFPHASITVSLVEGNLRTDFYPA